METTTKPSTPKLGTCQGQNSFTLTHRAPISKLTVPNVRDPLIILQVIGRLSDIGTFGNK